jgi:hypothetical protein
MLLGRSARALGHSASSGPAPKESCQANTSLVALLWLEKLRRFPNEETAQMYCDTCVTVVLGRLGKHLGKAHLPTGQTIHLGLGILPANAELSCVVSQSAHGKLDCLDQGPQYTSKFGGSGLVCIKTSEVTIVHMKSA